MATEVTKCKALREMPNHDLRHGRLTPPVKAGPVSQTGEFMQIDITALELAFNEKKPLYDRLATNIKSALEQFLVEAEIDFVDVECRVKEFDSFIKKIERKGYAFPFDEIDDVCGIRIINYYSSDLDKVTEIIKREFDVIEVIDKQDQLDESQFGYRSYHYIAKLKKAWVAAPNYRGLASLKFEIQARTILMHGWAAISHKLSYKHEDDVPKRFRRDLFRLSALIELADEQFERLRNERNEYKTELRSYSGDILDISKLKELNIDTLQALLNHYFPTRAKVDDLSSLLKEIKEAGVSIKLLNDKIIKTLPRLEEIEREQFSELERELSAWAQVGAVRMILDLTVDRYYKKRKFPEEHKEFVDKWRAKLKLND